MRSLLLLALATTALAQSGPRLEVSHTTESLRGASAVSRQVAWASGTHGTYLRTSDAGRTWTPAQVPDAAALDFRAVVAFSADEAFLMSSGPGDQSRIYHTSDAGQHWQLQFTNTNPKGFFDSMVFWDPKHGVVLGDPITDDTGKLKFELLETEDGQTWNPIPSAQLPEASTSEGAFAASNTCLAIVPSAGALDQNLWFATGGAVARVFHSPDRGKTWQVFDTPILHGPDSAGIFSIAFRDPLHGVIAGGNYKRPKDDGPELAFTDDGGKTWTLAPIKPQAYFSAVAYDRGIMQAAARQAAEEKTVEQSGKKIRVKPITPERLFIVGPDFVFDYHLPNNPHRIGGKKKQGVAFNAVSAFPDGGALVVGPKGTIAFIP
ncbi:MAG TPA: glycosyl hydrolase [Candidatus Sulfotelmatobacter sp.]|nr:glycosyl hydrolase [Candidatus Sulfotelmatobacter sp.]